ncbi:nuclear exosome regulator NRDE2 [Leptinotarsa decemlineata]|uniref:nuclear exosome regulator NRDE2 n=1 Tax=Leptinotarsa decemlineata TaxID=7539 RepID=UPI003D305940
MSLFPAYEEQAKVQEPIWKKGKDESDTSWLTNSSFQIDLETSAKSGEIGKSVTIKVVDSKKDKKEVPTHASNTRKRKKSRKKDIAEKKEKYDHSPILPGIEENFSIDVSGCRELLKVPTIYGRPAPKYRVAYYLNVTQYRSKKKFKRYHELLPEKNTDGEQVITKQNIDQIGFASRDDNFPGFKQEQELSQQTGFFNSHLENHPNDIEVWLDYIQFQNVVYQFEKTYRKGSIAKAQRVLAERKLSILDKAMSFNPESESLHRERLNIVVGTFPADEQQAYLKDLVEKDKGNIILWQGYIESTQCSMSHCNTPAVLSLYTKCLSTLHQLRRTTFVEKNLLEENILKMLYQCGLYMKQAGLFEQLWTLLRMYLELNLSPNDKTKFNITSGFREKQLIELEDIIFTSNLPLHELWLRTERLRESCHWLPYLDDENCEDPQRIVFTEDVAELIHPITVADNIFKLTATVFSLLKIPLLPCRHSTMRDLGLDYVPWSLDSIEPLLSVFLPLYPVEIAKEYLWIDNRLAVGPQYLKKIPGHEEYLNFIIKIMENAASCLSGSDKIAITVWFFRFQRLLIVLDRMKLFTITDSFKKNIKKKIKEFLKREENRQNEIYYLEYALIEYELGNTDNCFTIINTALSLNVKPKIVAENWLQSQTIWCFLYRNLLHLILHMKKGSLNDKKALEALCEMILQRNKPELTESVLNEAETKLELISNQLIQNDIPKLQPLHHFLPDFLTDWLMCHGWFIYLRKGPEECCTFLAASLQEFEKKNSEPSWQKEVLNEFYVAILFKYSRDKPAGGLVKLLDEVIFAAVEKYPNNLLLLSVLERQQTLVNSLGPRWWKVQNLLLKSERALSSLFSVIIVNQQMVQLQEVTTDTITGNKYDVNTSLKNKMLALFKKITSNVNTRKCGLVWRLYLQFVYTYFSPEICRNVYYSAVEECPWLKALYIDAAIYIPAELPQIQDLIIEKQLRLHVTPEELDVLRN